MIEILIGAVALIVAILGIAVLRERNRTSLERVRTAVEKEIELRRKIEELYNDPSKLREVIADVQKIRPYSQGAVKDIYNQQKKLQEVARRYNINLEDYRDLIVSGEKLREALLLLYEKRYRITEEEFKKRLGEILYTISKERKWFYNMRRA